MTVKEFNVAWIASMVRLQKEGVKQEDVEVILVVSDDGILEVSKVMLEESDSDEYAEHKRSGGSPEYTLVIEGV